MRLLFQPVKIFRRFEVYFLLNRAPPDSAGLRAARRSAASQGILDLAASLKEPITSVKLRYRVKEARFGQAENKQDGSSIHSRTVPYRQVVLNPLLP
jgi:hypothetical protein